MNEVDNSPPSTPIRFNLRGLFAFSLVISVFLAFHRHLHAGWSPRLLLFEVVAFHLVLLITAALALVYLARNRPMLLALSALCAVNSGSFLLLLAINFAPGYESIEFARMVTRATDVFGTLGIYLFGPAIALAGLYHFVFRQQ